MVWHFHVRFVAFKPNALAEPWVYCLRVRNREQAHTGYAHNATALIDRRVQLALRTLLGNRARSIVRIPHSVKQREGTARDEEAAR